MTHEHEWYPLSAKSTDGGEAETVLWACSGRTKQGACLAVATADTIQRERDKQQWERERRAYEEEQRHWNWEGIE